MPHVADRPVPTPVGPQLRRAVTAVFRILGWITLRVVVPVVLVIVGLGVGAIAHILLLFRMSGDDWSTLEVEYRGAAAAIQFVALATVLETLVVRGIAASIGLHWRPWWKPWLGSLVVALVLCLLALFLSSPW